MGGWVDGRTVCHGTMETASPGTFVCLTDRPTDCRVTPRQRFPRHARLVAPGHGPDGVGGGLP